MCQVLFEEFSVFLISNSGPSCSKTEKKPTLPAVPCLCTAHRTGSREVGTTALLSSPRNVGQKTQYQPSLEACEQGPLFGCSKLCCTHAQAVRSEPRRLCTTCRAIAPPLRIAARAHACRPAEQVPAGTPPIFNTKTEDDAVKHLQRDALQIARGHDGPPQDSKTKNTKRKPHRQRPQVLVLLPSIARCMEQTIVDVLQQEIDSNTNKNGPIHGKERPSSLRCIPQQM